MTNRAVGYLIKDQTPIVVEASRKVRDACALMCERRAGSVLVVDGHGHLIGIFTGRDAVHLLARGSTAGDLQICEAMTRDPVTVTPHQRATDGLLAMTKGGFRHLPVTEEGKVLGIVCRSDFKGMEFEEYRVVHSTEPASAPDRPIAEVAADRKPVVMGPEDTVGEACRRMCEFSIGSVLVGDLLCHPKGIFTGRDAVRILASSASPGETPLIKAMTPDPVTVGLEQNAIDALRAMNDGGFRHLPVVDRGRIVGVVARSDFTGTELDRLDEETHLAECIW